MTTKEEVLKLCDSSLDWYVRTDDKIISNRAYGADVTDEITKLIELAKAQGAAEERARNGRMDTDKLRAEFERQHAGRNLLRHRLRGTYSSSTIAALWNQHVRSAEFGAAEEREACLKICEDFNQLAIESRTRLSSAFECAEAIRNRGKND